MSKIYEALRQHEQQPTLGDAPSRPSHVLDDLSIANRDMQTLYRSVEAAIAGIQGGVVIMFSSAHPGEGKTTVCGGFAVTLAQNFGRSVLILDGDRDHALTRRFGSEGGATVSSLDKSPETVLQGAKRFGARGAIVVVPIASLVGLANADSPELDLIATIKDKLAKTFEYILIDAPSVADVPWSPSIGRTADGVILVIEAERTRWPVVMNAKLEFENSGAKVLGVFLNKRRFYIPPRIYRYL
jgi:Mrp family chromosome partitioning ATPase